jgi:hypothetical protein
LRLAKRQTDEADMTSTGAIMLKSSAIITLIAAMIAAGVASAQGRRQIRSYAPRLTDATFAGERLGTG